MDAVPASGFFIATVWGKQAFSGYSGCVSENKRFVSETSGSGLLECRRYCSSKAFVRELLEDSSVTMLKCVPEDSEAC